MSRFVGSVTFLEDALHLVSETLRFPWQVTSAEKNLQQIAADRLAETICAKEDYPKFTRSLRDGYALNACDTLGASNSFPLFLRLSDSVKMGERPEFTLSATEVASIPTGGELPEGADAVIMLEDTTISGQVIEIRRQISKGENVIHRGEEARKGESLLPLGSFLDFTNVAILAAMGYSRVPCLSLRIGIISTGDEIVPVETEILPDGCVRDINANMLMAILRENNYEAEFFGIVPDCYEKLKQTVAQAMERCDVIVISGGSSVGMRDHTANIMRDLPSPGLILHGLNISPGKPALIAGCQKEKKLLLGLPGHPLSCLVTCIVLLLPLLHRLVGSSEKERCCTLTLGKDMQGKAGVDEFVLGYFNKEFVYPIQAKSGYVVALAEANCLIRLPKNRETARLGEKVEVLLW